MVSARSANACDTHDLGGPSAHCESYPLSMSTDRPSKRAKRAERSPTELAKLALDATAAPFFAERCPATLCCVVALLSRAHRDGMTA